MLEWASQNGEDKEVKITWLAHFMCNKHSFENTMNALSIRKLQDKRHTTGYMLISEIMENAVKVLSLQKEYMI